MEGQEDLNQAIPNPRVKVNQNRFPLKLAFITAIIVAFLFLIVLGLNLFNKKIPDQVVVEVENMYRAAFGSPTYDYPGDLKDIGKTIFLKRSGLASTEVKLPNEWVGKELSIEVLAKGVQALQGWPKAAIILDGDTLDIVTVNSTESKNYTAKSFLASKDKYTLQIFFYNSVDELFQYPALDNETRKKIDLNNPKIRSLYLDKVIVRPVQT